jgi:hypothetical protein
MCPEIMPMMKMRVPAAANISTPLSMVIPLFFGGLEKEPPESIEKDADNHGFDLPLEHSDYESPGGQLFHKVGVSFEHCPSVICLNIAYFSHLGNQGPFIIERYNYMKLLKMKLII